MCVYAISSHDSPGARHRSVERTAINSVLRQNRFKSTTALPSSPRHSTSPTDTLVTKCGSARSCSKRSHRRRRKPRRRICACSPSAHARNGPASWSSLPLLRRVATSVEPSQGTAAARTARTRSRQRLLVARRDNARRARSLRTIRRTRRRTETRARRRRNGGRPRSGTR